MLPCVQHQYFSWLLVCATPFAYVLFQLWAPRLPPTYHTAKTTMNTLWHVHMSMDESFMQISDYRMWISLISLESAFSEWLHQSTLPPAMQKWDSIFISSAKHWHHPAFLFFVGSLGAKWHLITLKLNFSIFCISSSLINCQLIPLAHFS